MELKRMPVRLVLLLALGFLAACGGTNPIPQPSETKAVPTAAANISTTTGFASQTPPAQANTSSTATFESPIAPETNPPGDIPDTQVFITFAAPSPGNYSLEVPEGWARTTNSSGVRFDNKFDGVSVTLKPATAASTVSSAAQNEVPALTQSERAFKVGDVTEVKLPGGQAVRITATANSDPDQVTGKQVRLEEEIYLSYHNGTMAMVKLWAPLGADNVDQWKRMSESFRWK